MGRSHGEHLGYVQANWGSFVELISPVFIRFLLSFWDWWILHRIWDQGCPAHGGGDPWRGQPGYKVKGGQTAWANNSITASLSGPGQAQGMEGVRGFQQGFSWRESWDGGGEARRRTCLGVIRNAWSGLGWSPHWLCASVSPPVVGGWCCSRFVWVQTQSFEDFVGKPLGKCSLHHGGELKMLILLWRSITQD